MSESLIREYLARVTSSFAVARLFLSAKGPTMPLKVGCPSSVRYSVYQVAPFDTQTDVY